MAVAVAVIEHQNDGRVIMSRLLGRLAEKIGPVGRSLNLALVCGLVPGPGAPVVTRSDSDEQHWVHVICGAMEDYARTQNLTMAYIGVQPAQSLLLHELHRRRYLHGVDLPVAILDVTWGDKQSYFEKLRTRRKNYAVAARKEIRRFERSGALVSRFSETDYAELYELLERHNNRKNSDDFQFRPDILKDLVTGMGDDCIVYVARKAALLIGVIVFLRRNENAWAWLVGVDHEADARNFCYFNLLFYYPCLRYPELGIRQVYFGNAVQYAKYRRGCDIVETRFFVRAKHSIFAVVLRPIFAMQRVYFKRKFFAGTHRFSNTGA